MIAGEEPFTLTMKDPLARSWIHSPYAPGPDPRLDVRSRALTIEVCAPFSCSP